MERSRCRLCSPGLHQAVDRWSGPRNRSFRAVAHCILQCWPAQQSYWDGLYAQQHVVVLARQAPRSRYPPAALMAPLSGGQGAEDNLLTRRLIRVRPLIRSCLMSLQRDRVRLHRPGDVLASAPTRLRRRWLPLSLAMSGCMHGTKQHTMVSYKYF